MKILIRFLAMAFLLIGNVSIADIIEDNNKYHCESNGIDMQKTQVFLNKFNDLVQADDRKTIAKLIHYPLEVYKARLNQEGIHFYIKDEQDFLGQYKSLFSDRAKKLLLENHKVNCHPLGYLCTAFGDFCFDYSDEKIEVSSIATLRNY